MRNPSASLGRSYWTTSPDTANHFWHKKPSFRAATMGAMGAQSCAASSLLGEVYGKR